MPPVPECECDPTGSESAICAPRGGQCPCKSNVMLQACSQCRVDHYGFSTGQGCTGELGYTSYGTGTKSETPRSINDKFTYM